LILAEHDNRKLNPSALSMVTAASKLSQHLSMLVAGLSCGPVAEQASAIAGVTKVYHVESKAFEHSLAENITNLLLHIQKAKGFGYVLAPASVFGKSVVPRLAALLDVAPITDVIGIKSGDTFVRPVYAGNALSTVQSLDATKLLTARQTAFDKASATGGKAPIEKYAMPDAEADAGLTSWVKDEVRQSTRPDLGSARAVVSGGRGMKAGENFKMLEDLADALGGGTVGASRAAVDAGFAPNDLQVGQTGKVVAPELYVAVGISGAIQHLAGMKDSKVIVAINKDKEAPIFQVADFGLVADLFKAVPELTKQVAALKKS